MRKWWVAGLLVCLMSALQGAGALPPEQESPQSSGAPDAGAPPHGRPAHDSRIERRLQIMSEQLNLTDEQQEKIRPLLKNETERIRELRSDPNLTRNRAQHQIARVRKNTRQKIAEVLTPEQRKQWQEMWQGHGAARDPREGDQDRGAAPPGGPAAPATSVQPH